MPMSRAEKAEFELLRKRAALAWPQYPKPAPVPEEEIRAARRFRGWWANAHSGRVGEGVVEGSAHAREPYTDKQLDEQYSGHSRVSLSQTIGGPWYRSRIDALHALRWAMSEKHATELANIDAAVEEEEHDHG